jgi:hypothetical protein
MEGQRGSGAGGAGQLVKAFLPGTCLVLLGFALMFVFPSLLPVEQRSSLLFFSGMAVIVAGVLLMSVLGYVVRMRLLERGLETPAGVVDSVREIGADKEFESKEFLVFRKNDIYILLPKVFFIGFYLVRLLSRAKVSGNAKVKLPFRSPTGLIRKGRFQYEVDGFSVAKSRGVFVVPTDAVKLSERSFQESYVRGPGVLYFVFRYDLEKVAIYPGSRIAIDRLMSRQHYHPMFDLSDRLGSATVVKLMEKLSKEGLKG